MMESPYIKGVKRVSASNKEKSLKKQFINSVLGKILVRKKATFAKMLFMIVMLLVFMTTRQYLLLQFRALLTHLQ